MRFADQIKKKMMLWLQAVHLIGRHSQNKDQKMVLIYQVAAGNKLADLAIQISDTASFKIRKYKGCNYNQ